MKTEEERLEQKRITNRLYRANMTPEHKARLAANKKVAEPRNIALRTRVRKVKVVNQPANTMILKEIAKSVGMLTPQFRALTVEPKYKFPLPTAIRIDGMDLYDTFAIKEWVIIHREALTQASILGARRKSRGEFKLEPHVMLLINWIQASKHVQEYCNKQRFAITSAALWSKYA